MKKYSFVLAVSIGFALFVPACADVYTGQWKMFIDKNGEEISANQVGIGLAISKSGEYYNVVVQVPEIPHQEELSPEVKIYYEKYIGEYNAIYLNKILKDYLQIIVNLYSGKYALSDDEKRIERLTGEYSFKYRKSGKLICAEIGCFNHGKPNLGGRVVAQKGAGSSGDGAKSRGNFNGQRAANKDIIGTWRGTVPPQSGSEAYDAVITLDSVGSGSTKYPSLKCGGTLSGGSAGRSTYKYAETITSGRCMSGNLKIQITEENDMLCTWETVYKGINYSSSATLRKDEN